MSLKDLIIVAVDFDGTIVEDKFPDIGIVTQLGFAVKKLQREYNSNRIKWILWTCRNGKRLEEAVDFTKEHGFRWDAVNENLPETIAEYGGGDTRKVYANLYLDDKNLKLTDNLTAKIKKLFERQMYA